MKAIFEIEVPDLIIPEFLEELNTDGLVQIWYYAAERNENVALYLRKEGL